MTLDRDRKKHLRPPMPRGLFIALIVVVVIVFGYVIWWSLTSGMPLF